MYFHLLGPMSIAAATFAAVAHAAAPHPSAAAPPDAHDLQLPPIAANDNRRPAGTLVDGVLTLELRASVGLWRPQGEAGPALRVEAFGEGSSPLSSPAPLIRVPAGMEIAATIRNELTSQMRVYGLCEHGGATCAPIDVPGGDSRQVRFRSGAPGTYHYWATTTGMPLSFRATGDTQLSGAFVVDVPEAGPDADRIFVITDWTSLTPEQLKEIGGQDDPGASFMKLSPEVLSLINGRAWPHTERLTYELGETVHWRVINLTGQAHPLHMHGFYFAVDSLGDGMRDMMFGPTQTQHVVTQLLPPGATMGITWTPERVGNWLFHCHTMVHVSPVLHVDGSPREHEGHDNGDHRSAGMKGMVLGITVLAREGTRPPESKVEHQKARQLTVLMQSEPKRFGDAPAYGFLVAEGSNLPVAEHVSVPGPTLVLKRGEPVEIAVVNRLPEGTSIHWHGMELDSYYDGVHGWSGAGEHLTPLVEPGGSFVVRFTPPRTGTFIYHTHAHDHRQLTSGLYGAMIVVEPDETYDEASDHVFVMGRGGPQLSAPTVLNGQREPQVAWQAGARHRVRLINITPGDTFSVTLQTNEGPVTWRPLTKDGAPLPVDRSQPRPAKQLIGVGETYDFEYQAPPGRQTLWLEVRSPGGKWHTQGHVIVR
jgi:FtsP/CotA-like multicopper oxidase with cupredoxin domain